MKYIVPEYYKTFSCKGGACRHTCCHGWGITLTMEEYYRILGMDCDARLRRRLDTAFYPVDKPTEERYAAVNHRYDGDCPLHAEDGLCELHRQMGENAIPSVCRMYPRSVRSGCCSCTNSCEQTLELIFGLGDIMKFETADYDYPYGGTPEDGSDDILHRAIAMLSDTSVPLTVRLHNILVQNGVEAKKSNETRIGDFISILERISEGSESFREYVLPRLTALGENGERTEELLEKFEGSFSKHELIFANILINHVFYERFGCDGRIGAVCRDCIALCAVYAVMRLIAAENAAMCGSVDELIDALAGAFRCIEHSSFNASVCHYMANLGVTADDLLVI